jgi:hypothetical protein
MGTNKLWAEHKQRDEFSAKQSGIRRHRTAGRDVKHIDANATCFR